MPLDPRRVPIIQEADVTRALLEARMFAKSMAFTDVDTQMIATQWVIILKRNIVWIKLSAELWRFIAVNY